MTPEQPSGRERLTNDIGCVERPLVALEELRAETLFGDEALADLLQCDPARFESWENRYTNKSFFGKDLNLIGRLDAVSAVTDVLRGKSYPDEEIPRIVFETTVSEALTLADIIKGPACAIARAVAQEKIKEPAGSRP